MRLRYLILTLFYACLCGTFKYTNDIIHENAELGKVCHTKDGDNLILSKVYNGQKMLMSKLDERGNFLYHNSLLDISYTGNAQVMESKTINGEDGYTLYHKTSGKEYLTQLKDEGQIERSGQIVNNPPHSTYHEQSSSFTLKNGKIFFSGITKPSANYVQTAISLRIFDPKDFSELNGQTLQSYSKYISCFELNENDVYCVYVYGESNLIVSLLGIQHFKIGETGIVEQDEPYLIKAFYTQFNYLKAMPYKDNEVIILFQTGNKDYENIPNGNTGKDLYYYHLDINPTGFKVIRYDYLSTNCRFTDNAEDYTVDITTFDKNILIICEVENDGKDYAKYFRAYNVTSDVKKIPYFDFNQFDGLGVKNPLFVKFKDYLGVLYTHVVSANKKNVNLIMMNYPDCNHVAGNVKFYGVCPNGNATKPLSKHIDTFMVNPYPTFMQNAKVYFRFVNMNNMVIYNGNKSLELNKDYDPAAMKDLYIKEYHNEEDSYLDYTASKINPDKTYLLGRTCRIDIKYPKCQDQCLGCDENSTPEDHHCFDCQHGYYPIKKGVDTTGCGSNSSYYNCLKCDIACKRCYGPFLNSVPPTTNCKQNYCNIEDNYFPYEDDYRTCFNASDKEKWEKLLKLDEVLFLDKNNSTNKGDWVWRKCHKNCAECNAKGDDKNNKCSKCKANLFFYCNQTKLNGGIPGSCHPSCEGDGCYKSDPNKTEGMEKMCPCFANCKVCQGPDSCDECRSTWLLPPERTSCNKSCDYCLTPYFEEPKTLSKGRCINCKTEFTPEQYTYDNKCFEKDKIPYFNYTEYGNDNLTYSVKQFYHVIDSKCNLLTGCKKGCHKCSVLETDRCTECEEGYYKEDPFNVTRKTFKCFERDVCHGTKQYPHDPELKIGGVCITENNEKICLNCKQRNDSYRQPAEDFYCGTKRNRTYVEIPDWHTLSYCYVRCKECERWGTSCSMNCLACRDSKYYDLIRYNKKEGQCYRKQHKCGIYPYYHNYEIAIDEDDCGEDCDVCLYNFQCPKEFPYFKYETHECVEFCPVTDVLGGACNVNSSAAVIILMRNPFGLKSPYDLLNNTLDINQIISSSLFQYICASYNCDVNKILSDYRNYFGNGKVYNLPESHVYIGNNISIELTSVKLELEKLKKLIDGGDDTKDDPNTNTTILNISECEQILKKKYGLPEEEELIIVKSDVMKEFNISGILPEFPEVDYQLFSTSLGAFLPLSVCQQENTEVTVTNPFGSPYNLLNLFQSKTASVISSGYDVFDAYSPFYNDICTPFTNENGNDVLLDSRRKDYYDENINLCGKDCTFIGYNAAGKTYTCRCNIKAMPGDAVENYKGEIVERTMPENFKKLVSRRSNIDVFKCASQAFSAKGQKKNFGSYILLIGIASFIGIIVFHFLKERKLMGHEFDKLGKIDSKKSNKNSESENVANPPKNKNEEDNKKNEKKDKKEKKDKNKEEKKEKGKKPKKDKVRVAEKLDNGYTTGKNMYHQKEEVRVVQDLLLEDDQLNYASYETASEKDKRNFLATYWSFLKFKQTIIFTFYTKTAGILRSTKIALFILFVAFYMTFTALFFNDNIMRNIYIYKGNTKAAVHVPNIILSSLCSFIASLIVRFICLGERDIAKIITENDIDKRRALAVQAKKKAFIKTYVLYIISAILLGVCWYYISAFCAVFKNSQKNYLINTLVSFIICNLWPGVTSLIPTFMRRKALEGKNKALYRASQIVSVF